MIINKESHTITFELKDEMDLHILANAIAIYADDLTETMNYIEVITQIVEAKDEDTTDQDIITATCEAHDAIIGSINNETRERGMV